ncbi:hypothetical protein R1sor_004917 [Riccia sorocarpa]|uniref:Transposase n=1 Tax=Riccia sorocarpa TaxID=122646 RepID=A0ABD3HK94_9MARC
MKTLKMFGISEISREEYEESIAKAFVGISGVRKDSETHHDLLTAEESPAPEILDERRDLEDETAMKALAKGKRLLDSQQNQGCTIKKRLPGRPLNVAIQRLLKARFARNYHEWAIQQMKTSLDIGVEVTGTKFDASIGKLQAKVCEWMWAAHSHVAGNPKLIQKGWADCGFIEAWKFDVQKEVLLANSQGQLFKEHIREQIGLEIVPVHGVQDLNASLDNLDLLEQEEEEPRSDSTSLEHPRFHDFTQENLNVVSGIGFQAYLTDLASISPYEQSIAK